MFDDCQWCEVKSFILGFYLKFEKLRNFLGILPESLTDFVVCINCFGEEIEGERIILHGVNWFRDFLTRVSLFTVFMVQYQCVRQFP